MPRHWLRLGYLVLVLSGGAMAFAEQVEVGVPAPDFSLVDQNGATHTLAQYRGRWVVLYFYPKNDTPGCTKEACSFRDGIFELRASQAEVLGLSLDSLESHVRFAEKHGLPFPLLADEGGHTARRYGSLFSLGFFKWAKRHTFIIDPQGRVAKVYREVTPATHGREVLNDLKALQAHE